MYALLFYGSCRTAESNEHCKGMSGQARTRTEDRPQRLLWTHVGSGPVARVGTLRCPLTTRSPEGRMTRNPKSNPESRRIEMGPNSGRAVAFLFAIGTMSGQPVTWVNAELKRAPSPRCCSGMAYDRGRQGTILFGGAGPGGPFGDTWLLQNSVWSQLSPAAAPPAREGAGMIYDGAAQNIVMFGGLWRNSPQTSNKVGCYAAVFSSIGVSV